jgi:hypothetical protein
MVEALAPKEFKPKGAGISLVLAPFSQPVIPSLH